VKGEVIIAVAPRKPLWIEDQRKMSQQVHANRNKFRRLVQKARERA